MKIVADDKIPFLKGVLEPFAEIDYLPGDQISNATLKNAKALLTRSITKCNKELLSNTSVELIVSATIGDDHIDKQYCADNDIQWANAKGCNASAVEQYVFAALLHLAKIHRLNLANKTLGVIGVGNIGSRVAKLAAMLGMHVLLNDPPRAQFEGQAKFVSLEKILNQADIITLHVPLISVGENKTQHLANGNFFKQLNKKCIFINTSRGEVVESSALMHAIKSGKVNHAIIDVWENEPEINVGLLDRVEIATPHIAGYSIRGKANGTSMIVQAVSNYFKFGLDFWYPEMSEEIKIVELDCENWSLQQVMQEIYNQVYAIGHDVKNLKTQVEKFEHLRGNYALRPENDSFYLKLSNCQNQINETLKSSGFIL